MVANQADSIRSSLAELRKAGLIGAVLSFFMLFFFLRHLPTTLIVSLAVPASLLVTLGAMYFLGLTLNVLTMMGMLVAIGMLVDVSLLPAAWPMILAVTLLALVLRPLACAIGLMAVGNTDREALRAGLVLTPIGEFSLIMATIRLVNSGVFDRHPNLTVHMAHLSGGMASMLGRIRSYQDKEFWGTKGNPRHGAGSAKDFDYYINNNLVFDTAGFAGATQFVRKDDVADNIPCGPDLDAIVDAVREFEKAGFTDVALVQVGDEHQEEFLGMAEKELLPALRG